MVMTDARRGLRGPAWLLDGVLHLLAILLVLGQVSSRWGNEGALAAALLFPITYLVGPITLGVVAGDWLPFAVQLVAIVSAVGLVGVPAIDREQRSGRGCLQLLATSALVVIVDLALHVAALALVIDRINAAWGTQSAVVAAVFFPLTYLVGPLVLAITGADWLPLLVQLAAVGLIGLLVLLSDT